MENKQKKSERKPYSPPELTRFGDLRELTRAKGGAKQDGGAKPSTRSTGAPS